jgi:peptide/nickel transport system substrate-binding protein
VFILDRDWAQTNKAAVPQDLKNKADNHAARSANGTGPFRLVSREPDVRTVMVRNEQYWGRGSEVPLGIAELVYIPIRSDATRVAALLSGEIDFVQDVPVADLDHLKTVPTLHIAEGLENRTIFFGMDVGSADLKSDNVPGKNPLADRRVRQAMNIAIDRDAIRRTIMRGRAIPAGVIMPPFVNGWTAALDKLPAPNLEHARALLRDAGYGSGFSITLHCPNDRYVADSSICQAVVGMLGHIGIRVSLVSQSKAKHFPLITREPPETEFYLLGVGVPTFDSQYILDDVLHSRTPSRGTWNGSRYSNREIDRRIESLAGEVDEGKRNETIAEIWRVVQQEVLFLPLHHQMIAYAMKPWIDIPVDVSNAPKLKRAVVKAH